MVVAGSGMELDGTGPDEPLGARVAGIIPAMVLVAVHSVLWELVEERLAALGSRIGEVTLVDRAPADIAIDCATGCTTYALDGDVVLLAASNPELAALALEVAPLSRARLRRTALDVEAPLAQAVADSGGLGLAVVGHDLDDQNVQAGVAALTDLLGTLLAKFSEDRLA